MTSKLWLLLLLSAAHHSTIQLRKFTSQANHKSQLPNLTSQANDNSQLPNLTSQGKCSVPKHQPNFRVSLHHPKAQTNFSGVSSASYSASKLFGRYFTILKIASRLFLFYLLFSTLTSFFFFRWSWGDARRVLLLYLKLAIFVPELARAKGESNLRCRDCESFQPELQEHAPRTTFVLKSCDFQAGAAADQGGIEPATAGLRTQARKPRDNFQRPFREQENRTAPQRERFHTQISGSRQIRAGPQRERSDTHDPRRGFIGLKTDSHGTTARALRHARSPQRVRCSQDRCARRHSESASTRAISAEASPRTRQIRTAPQRERFDMHDLRRGFAVVKTNSHGATARALRHAQSPQRVRRGFAEGSPRSRQIRTAPQRERFDTHDLRRGCVS